MTRYVSTLVALLVLTGLTFGLSFASLGAAGTVLAMLIATAKAALVVLFFMHLLEHQNSSRTAFMIALGLAASLIVFIVMDVRTR